MLGSSDASLPHGRTAILEQQVLDIYTSIFHRATPWPGSLQVSVQGSGSIFWLLVSKKKKRYFYYTSKMCVSSVLWLAVNEIAHLIRWFSCGTSSAASDGADAQLSASPFTAEARGRQGGSAAAWDVPRQSPPFPSTNLFLGHLSAICPPVILSHKPPSKPDPFLEKKTDVFWRGLEVQQTGLISPKRACRWNLVRFYCRQEEGGHWNSASWHLQVCSRNRATPTFFYNNNYYFIFNHSQVPEISVCFLTAVSLASYQSCPKQKTCNCLCLCLWNEVKSRHTGRSQKKPRAK